MSDDAGFEAMSGAYNDGYEDGVKQGQEDAAEEALSLRARIARALDALRTAPDLDTAEPSRTTLRRAHTALLAAWAELADEPASVRQTQEAPDA